MKPRIKFIHLRWCVHIDGAPLDVCFILRDSAYAYAKAVWERKKR